MVIIKEPATANIFDLRDGVTIHADRMVARLLWDLNGSSHRLILNLSTPIINSLTHRLEIEMTNVTIKFDDDLPEEVWFEATKNDRSFSGEVNHLLRRGLERLKNEGNVVKVVTAT